MGRNNSESVNCKCRSACQNSWLDYRFDVSFKEIKDGVAELPEEQQHHLAAYFVHLRHQN